MQKTNRKLSIITICYKNIIGLQKTMDSVLCQSWTDFEHIVVDGGSNDGTLELLQKYETLYAKRGIHFLWVSETDNGIYHAMNKGVCLASGEYCNFLNSGDCFCDSKVLDKVYAQYNPHDILIGKAQTDARIIYPPKKISISFFYYHGSINHQAAFIRRKLLLEHPYNEAKGKISSDYQFFIESLLVNDCSYCPLDVMVVNFDANGISSRTGILQKIREEQTIALKSHYNDAELGDMEALQYENYALVRIAKRIVKWFLAVRRITKLSTYDNCLRVNRHPSRSLLFRRMLRNFYNRSKWYFQVGHRVTESAVSVVARKNPLIISLTSYPARMGTITQTVSSLMTQTLKPDNIILWLTVQQFPRREADVPLSVLNLRKYGLTIEWCNRPIRSYTKLVPSLQKYPNAIIVTADDDILYRRDWLAGLYNAYLKAPKQIHCYCSHHILLNEKHIPLPYNQWQFLNADSVSYKNMLMGVGGVLYPPCSLYKDVCNEDLFMKYAPHADDLWFWAMAVLNKTQIHTVHNRNSQTIPVANVNNEFALYNENSEGENDVQLKHLMDIYSPLSEALNAE